MKKFTTLAEACQAYQDQAAVLGTAEADLAAAQSLVEEAGQTQATAEAALVTSREAQTQAEERVTALEGQSQTATAAQTASDLKVSALEADAKTAEERAAAICAAAGVDPVVLEQGGEGSGEGSLTEQYAAITDPGARSEFLAKHETAIYKEQTAKKS